MFIIVIVLVVGILIMVGGEDPKVFEISDDGYTYGFEIMSSTYKGFHRRALVSFHVYFEGNKIIIGLLGRIFYLTGKKQS